MIQPLTPTQQKWVDDTLADLPLAGAVAQLLSVTRPWDEAAEWLKLYEQSPFGAMSIRARTAEAYQAVVRQVQAGVPIPLCVIANMEHGAAEWPGYGTDFPFLMAAGAADDPALSAAIGAATAVEARHLGVNWALTPCVDINYNFNNPVTNIRALGDRPDLINRLAPPLIHALQSHGVAATTKHFPGDGLDDRDQHLLTTINHLPFDQWLATYGIVWREIIAAGAWTIMPGHIALPDYQGYRDDPAAAPPATTSYKLLTELLRGELGFEGVIVSDSTSMIGLTSRAAPAERIVQSVAAGIDVYLGADPVRDHAALMSALADGRLSEARIYEAVRRVLSLNARLNLAEAPLGPAPSADQQTAYTVAAQQLADQSLTVIRGAEQLPVPLEAGARVLTVTIAQLKPMFGQTDLEIFDAELRARGYEVTHLLNPTTAELTSAAAESAVVFINVYVTPMTHMGTNRVVQDSFPTWGWRALYNEHPNVYYTSFGSPYLLHEMPHIPNLLAAYGGAETSQRAAVRVWLGELAATGQLPVALPQIKVRGWPDGA